MILPFTNLFFSPPWNKYFPSPNIFLLFILHLLVIVNVNVKDLNRTNKNQNSNKRHCLLGLVLAFFAPSLPLGIYMCSNTKYHHWHTSMSIFNRSTSELRVQPATFSLLTHLVTTWNQEMLAHLKKTPWYIFFSHSMFLTLVIGKWWGSDDTGGDHDVKIDVHFELQNLWHSGIAMFALLAELSHLHNGLRALLFIQLSWWFW